MIQHNMEAMAPLYAALAKAQAAFPEIPKSKKGHGYNYAPKDVLLRIVRPVLAKHGLGVTQRIEGEDVVTVLFHETGATLSSHFPMAAIGGRMNPMQELGARSTYASRYALELALGICGTEDVDASEQGSAGPVVTDDWRDTRHDDAGTGVKGVKVDPQASKEEKAKAFAEGLIGQFSEAKTQKGLDGLWKRNEGVIDRLSASYSSLYENVVDAFMARQRALNEPDTANDLAAAESVEAAVEAVASMFRAGGDSSDPPFERDLRAAAKRLDVDPSVIVNRARAFNASEYPKETAA